MRYRILLTRAAFLPLRPPFLQLLLFPRTRRAPGPPGCVAHVAHRLTGRRRDLAPRRHHDRDGCRDFHRLPRPCAGDPAAAAHPMARVGGTDRARGRGRLPERQWRGREGLCGQPVPSARESARVRRYSETKEGIRGMGQEPVRPIGIWSTSRYHRKIGRRSVKRWESGIRQHYAVKVGLCGAEQKSRSSLVAPALIDCSNFNMVVRGNPGATSLGTFRVAAMIHNSTADGRAFPISTQI